MAPMSENDFVEMLDGICNGLTSRENRHLFVIDLIKSLDKFIIPNRRSVIKRFLMNALKQFTSSPLRSVHLDVFPLWLVLAQYSETMNVEKVLDHIEHLYEDHLPYYRAYINELLSNNKNAEAVKMFEKCKNKCGLTDQELADEFPTLSLKSAPAEELESVQKIDVFKQDAQKKPGTVDVLKPIHVQTPVRALESVGVSATQEDTDEDDSSIIWLDDDDDSVHAKVETVKVDVDAVSVKKIVDFYNQNDERLGMFIGSLIGAQLARILSSNQDVYDLSPQSVIISTPFEENLTPEDLVDKCVLKIVSPKKTCSGLNDAAKSANFLDVVGHLLFLGPFGVCKTDQGNVVDAVIPRRYPDRDIWADIFHRLLNSNNNFKDWDALANDLKESFVRMTTESSVFLQDSVKSFNENYSRILST